jgi:hypothetical protein
MHYDEIDLVPPPRLYPSQQPLLKSDTITQRLVLGLSIPLLSYAAERQRNIPVRLPALHIHHRSEVDLRPSTVVEIQRSTITYK